jgi:hypothetical protein
MGEWFKKFRIGIAVEADEKDRPPGRSGGGGNPRRQRATPGDNAQYGVQASHYRLSIKSG